MKSLYAIPARIAKIRNVNIAENMRHPIAPKSSDLILIVLLIKKYFIIDLLSKHK
jgi:hypothetical protein